ncbi:MAG TPA: hypothetical protein VMF06_20385 [Candidatus Limnocylindria bacterium]|nr:hypothetical protein [Candidatus Limnocylindria bacterium]
MVTKEIATHQVVLEFEEPVAAEIPAGSDLVLRLKVSCSAGCDLTGGTVRLMSGEETIQEVSGTRPNEAEESALKVPKELGTYSWTILFPRQEANGVVHEEASVPVTFATKPHESSLAVWDVPSTAVTGERFRVKVGARSSGACVLKGTKVDILDTDDAVVGSGQLGDTPWPGTSALYWKEVELTAPAKEGIVSWTARFAATDSELPHTGARVQFGFAAVLPPEHRLTIKIVEQDTEKPIENVQIRLGPFRSATDECGVAELSMPKGSYEMTIWHPRWESPSTQVEVFEDATIELRSTPVPEDDPDARWA